MTLADNALVAIDFSPASLAALERAKALVGKGGKLRLLHVVAVAAAPGHSDRHAVERFYDDLAARARACLEAVARDLGGDGYQVEVDVTTGRPADEIVGAATLGRPGLVVLGSHARSVLTRVVLGSVAEEVARRSPIPTLVVRERLRETPGKVARILLAVDHDAPSRYAIRWAAELSRRLGVPLEAIHAIEAPILPHGFQDVVLPPSPMLAPEVVDQLRCRIADDVERIAGSKVPVHILAGSAASLIVRFARKDDVIVMGTHGRSGLEKLAFGSVATKVLRRAPCPVLLARPVETSQASPAPPARASAAR